MLATDSKVDSHARTKTSDTARRSSRHAKARKASMSVKDKDSIKVSKSTRDSKAVQHKQNLKPHISKRLRGKLEDSELVQTKMLAAPLPIVQTISNISIGDVFMMMEFLCLFGHVLHPEIPTTIGRKFFFSEQSTMMLW